MASICEAKASRCGFSACEGNATRLSVEILFEKSKETIEDRVVVKESYVAAADRTATAEEETPEPWRLFYVAPQHKAKRVRKVRQVF